MKQNSADWLVDPSVAGATIRPGMPSARRISATQARPTSHSPQIPPRNVTWFKMGKWVYWSKIVFEKYFLRKMRKGVSEPLFKKWALRVMAVARLKA
jgi:hypothetical protein